VIYVLWGARTPNIINEITNYPTDGVLNSKALKKRKAGILTKGFRLNVAGTEARGILLFSRHVNLAEMFAVLP